MTRKLPGSNCHLVSLACLLIAPALSAAQTKPVFTYNGVGRPFLVTVDRPARFFDLEFRLLEPVTGKVVEKGPVKPGQVDVAKVLPGLWTRKSKQVLYLQLFQDGAAVGSAVVLQPMTNPSVATLDADGKTIKFSPDEDRAYAGVRAWVDQNVAVETDLGTMEFRMRPDCAPNTVWNMLELIKGGFYRDIIFHRVVATRKDGTPFVIQAGDPTGTGSGSPGYSFVLEDSPLPHDFGVISMARSSDPNTNGAQFFVALSRDGTKHLDHRYASFGEAISGTKVILDIAKVKVGKEDRPEKPPVIKKIWLRPAAPYGTGPAPVQRPK